MSDLNAAIATQLAKLNAGIDRLKEINAAAAALYESGERAAELANQEYARRKDAAAQWAARNGERRHGGGHE